MSEIAELERRMTAAMDRIAQALDGLGPRPSGDSIAAQDGATATAEDSAELANLRQALEDEKLVTAQLEERIKVLKARLEAAEAAPAPEPAPEPAADVAQLHAQLEAAQATATSLDAQVQGLRAAGAQMQASMEALREAALAGVAEPDLINASLLAQLEALRAARAADMAEADAIIATITPLLTQEQNDQPEEANA